MKEINITKEMQFDFDERAGIFEYDGIFTRKEAEWKALYWMRKVYGLKFNMNHFVKGKK